MCTDVLPTAKAAAIDLDDVFACLFEPRPVGMQVFFVGCEAAFKCLQSLLFFSLLHVNAPKAKISYFEQMAPPWVLANNLLAALDRLLVLPQASVTDGDEYQCHSGITRVRNPLVDLLEEQDHLSMFVLLSV